MLLKSLNILAFYSNQRACYFPRKKNACFFPEKLATFCTICYVFLCTKIQNFTPNFKIFLQTPSSPVKVLLQFTIFSHHTSKYFFSCKFTPYLCWKRRCQIWLHTQIHTLSCTTINHDLVLDQLESFQTINGMVFT